MGPASYLGPGHFGLVQTSKLLTQKKGGGGTRSNSYSRRILLFFPFAKKAGVRRCWSLDAPVERATPSVQLA